MKVVDGKLYLLFNVMYIHSSAQKNAATSHQFIRFIIWEILLVTGTHLMETANQKVRLIFPLGKSAWRR